jgi:hypothetical protein
LTVGGAGARVAVALGLYLSGVGAGLLTVFYGCARCQQDNAYLGLSSLELLLMPLAGVLIGSGLLLSRVRSPESLRSRRPIHRYRGWLVAVLVVAVGGIWFFMLDLLRYSLATASAEVMLIGVGTLATLWLGGLRTLAATVTAAVLVFLLAELRGPQEWAVGVGVDGPVLVVALLLGLAVAWLSANRGCYRRSRRAAAAPGID